MARYMLDTDTCSYIMKRSNEMVLTRLQAVPVTAVCISVITKSELLYYSKIHGTPPAEADFQRYFRVTPPVVHQMIKTLHTHGFIDREPGKARSITLRVPRAQLPDLD